jgi:adenosine deaminase
MTGLPTGLSFGLSGGPPDAASEADQRDLFTRMPKAELHLHLDGSLRPASALEMARLRGVPGWSAADRPDPAAALAAMRSALAGPAQARDQAQLLRAFDLPIAILQDADALERAAHELVEDVAGDGTRYVEIRWAPALHTERGMGLHEGIAAVCHGARDGAAATTADGRPIDVRLIAVAMRSHAPSRNVDVAEAAVAFLREGLTGFDLAGPEAAFADPLPHSGAFGIARSGGLGISLHAGEWGGAAQVRRALQLDPARIAHGASAATDSRLQAELVAGDVTLDLCPTSNVQAGIYPHLSDHPLPRLVRSGVKVTLSTDDRTVSDLTLPAEYARVRRELGLTPRELWRLNRQALLSAFLQHDEPLRRRLLDEFDAFAAAEPDLR